MLHQDVMYIEKNICDSLLGITLDIDGRSKDTNKARIDLQNIRVCKELYLYKEGDYWMKLDAAYTLTPEDNKKFCEFLNLYGFLMDLLKILGKMLPMGTIKLLG